MSILESNTPDFQAGDPELQTGSPGEEQVDPEASGRGWFSSRNLVRIATWSAIVLVILGIVGFFSSRYYLHHAAGRDLPQLDGALAIPGLKAPVTIQRDAHGVPYIHAGSMDDLLVAQGFVTASDRLFQMDTLRRHAAGELAEILGVSVIGHDRLQRTLQLRAAADRAVASLPPDQLHVLEEYALGVNASIAQQSAHLPVEFRILRYQPAPWTPRDSILVSLAMFEDLTNTFPTRLAREALSARLPPELAADLYPVGSWRDHPPTSPIPDLTIPGPPIEDIPLDESQTRLSPPGTSASPDPAAEVRREISELSQADAAAFTPGSNNWVVSGAHTASGKPLLANDMHLAHSVPGIWYQADLEAPALPGQAEAFHVAGVTIPGLPLIIVGHNAHVAWGFTNLGAEVQDVYIESTRNNGGTAEFRSTDLSWQPILHIPEVIKIHGLPAETLEVAATRHGDTITPILDPALTAAAIRGRVLSLRWTIYDPSVPRLPMVAVDSAHDWPSFLAAFSGFGGPSQNVVYADDQGHIGYHAVGRVPLRGPAQAAADSTLVPSDIASPVAQRSSTQSPVISAMPNALARTEIQAPAAPLAAQFSGPIIPVPQVPMPSREWDGYIPFDQLPQIFDPPDGIIATANARTAPDDYRYPITLNWAAPYRNERIWKSLAHRAGLTPGDMLALQSDIYSDFDHVLAQRLAYALDNSLEHPARPIPAAQAKTLHQAADLLRTFNGRMTIDSPAAAIVASVHSVLWPMLIGPHLQPVRTRDEHPRSLSWEQSVAEVNSLYLWGEKDYALEQILMHQPPRWLPSNYLTWNEFLAATILRGLADSKAPADLSTWRYGAIHILDIEHPIFDQSALLARIWGRPTGTGAQPQSGDGTTVKQVGRMFGPSERFTADLANPDRSTLNLVLGESGNPISPWFMDQFPAWHRGSTFPFPFNGAAVTATHTLTLTPP